MGVTRLSHEVLDAIWVSWQKFYGLHSIYYNYANVSRRSLNGQKFEEFLFKNGAIVTRVNKKCYLDFFDEADAIAFRLRFSV